MKLSKNSETNLARRLVFIGKAPFSFHSLAYGNKNSYSPIGIMLLVIGVGCIFRQLQSKQKRYG